MKMIKILKNKKLFYIFTLIILSTGLYYLYPNFINKNLYNLKKIIFFWKEYTFFERYIISYLNNINDVPIYIEIKESVKDYINNNGINIFKYFLDLIDFLLFDLVNLINILSDFILFYFTFALIFNQMYFIEKDFGSMTKFYLLYKKLEMKINDLNYYYIVLTGRKIKEFIYNYLDYFKIYLIIFLLFSNILTYFLSELIIFMYSYMFRLKAVKMLIKILQSLIIFISLNFKKEYIIILLILSPFILFFIAYSLNEEKRNKNNSQGLNFVDSIPLITSVCGNMSRGKTKLVTYLSRMGELNYKYFFEDQMLIIENKLHLFNFHLLEADLMSEFYKNDYEALEIVYNKYLPFLQDLYKDKTIYKDYLVITDINKLLKDYINLFYLCNLRGTYILSNYTMKSKLFDSYSKIFNFDWTRLKKPMLEKSKKEFPFVPGTILALSEVDKDYNSFDFQELKGEKKELLSNDGFIQFLGFSSHIFSDETVERKIKILFDYQSITHFVMRARVKSDLIIEIDSDKETSYLKLFYLFNNFCLDRCNSFLRKVYNIRQDSTLLQYLINKLAHRLQKNKEFLYSRFYLKLKLRLYYSMEDKEKNQYKKYNLYINLSEIYGNGIEKIYNSTFLKMAYDRDKTTLKFHHIPTYKNIDPTKLELYKVNSYFFNETFKLK